jgi:Dyp-type peroxidase family
MGTSLRLVREQHTSALKDQKEHFGWRDGLSLPVFEGVPPGRGKPQQWWTTPLKPGEFVLGYHNEYGCLTESPTAAVADDPANHLPPAADGRKDLGKNGTYLVYREMTQDVHALWDYLAKRSQEPGADPVEKAVALGAKMVGRWPGGAPLETSPQRDAPGHATDNEFHYSADLAGMKCPVGSHIRRANPRDVLGSGRDTEDSTIMVRKHQMIRRGRPFGPPVAKSMDPREILATKPDGVPRGLHFICLVGHISRQFEFVQRAWIHSANFGALFKDGDPISATRRTSGSANPNDEFTCPAIPVRRKYKQLPQFTTLVGGAYFFLPGIAALKFISRHP